MGRERQLVDRGESLLQAQARSRDVDYRNRRQAGKVRGQRLAQRHVLGTVEAGKAGVGHLQRQGGDRNIASELQLLPGQRNRLLDLEEKGLFAAAGAVLGLRLQRGRLSLPIIELAFNGRKPCLQAFDLLGQRLAPAALLDAGDIEAGKPGGDLGAQFVGLAT